MKICISQITTLPSDMETDLASYGAVGWKNAELAFSKINSYLETHTLDELKNQLKKENIRPIAAIGLASSETGLLLTKPENIEVYMKSLKKQLSICMALGIRTLGIGADPSSKYYKGWQVHALENLRTAGDLAEKYGVVIGLEFMNLAPPIGPFILDNLNDTVRIVKEADHNSVGFNLDLFHFFRSGGVIDEIRDLDIEKLVNVHLCDIPELEPLKLDDSKRLLPGNGILPLLELVGILKNKEYNFYLSLELLNNEIWSEEPVKAAERCLAAMRKFETI